jgi:hypothetical protein
VPGPARLLLGGRNQAVASEHPAESVAGRTFAGLSADGRSLVLATIDGGELSGAAFYDEAAWLQLVGASDGLNLDGGGSSTMALRTPGVSPAALASALEPLPDAERCPPAAGDPVALLDVPRGYALEGETSVPPCRERLIGAYLGVVTGAAPTGP